MHEWESGAMARAANVKWGRNLNSTSSPLCSFHNRLYIHHQGEASCHYRYPGRNPPTGCISSRHTERSVRAAARCKRAAARGRAPVPVPVMHGDSQVGSPLLSFVSQRYSYNPSSSIPTLGYPLTRHVILVCTHLTEEHTASIGAPTIAIALNIIT